MGKHFIRNTEKSYIWVPQVKKNNFDFPYVISQLIYEPIDILCSQIIFETGNSFTYTPHKYRVYGLIPQ